MTAARSIPEAVSETVRAAMRRDTRLCVIEAAPAGEAGGIAHLDARTRTFHKEFGPWRVMRLAASPETVLGMGLGAAAKGLPVVVDLTEPDGMSGLLDELARQPTDARRAALVIRARLNSARARRMAAFAALAELCAVALPATPTEAQGLMLEALRLRAPALLLEAEGPAWADPMADFKPSPIPFGCAKTLRRGADLTIIAFAPHGAQAVEAANRLEKSDGIGCEVVDPRTLAPLDLRTIVESVERTGRLAVLEEEGLRCPVVGEIAARVAETAFSALIAPVARIRVAPGPQGMTLLFDALRTMFARRA